MNLKLPPGYHVELEADLLTLRRQDGSSVATFSARGVAMILVEDAAWEDHGDSPPSPGGERVKRRKWGDFLVAFVHYLALVMNIRRGLTGTVGSVAPMTRHALYQLG